MDITVTRDTRTHTLRYVLTDEHGTCYAVSLAGHYGRHFPPVLRRAGWPEAVVQAWAAAQVQVDALSPRKGDAYD